MLLNASLWIGSAENSLKSCVLSGNSLAGEITENGVPACSLIMIAPAVSHNTMIMGQNQILDSIKVCGNVSKLSSAFLQAQDDCSKGNSHSGYKERLMVVRIRIRLQSEIQLKVHHQKLLWSSPLDTVQVCSGLQLNLPFGGCFTPK